jgi:protein SCO1/2
MIELLAAAALLAQSYRVEGLVLEVRPADRVVVISHKAIEGVMPAMSMPLRVRQEKDLRGLTAGSYVDFELVRDGAATYARRIRVRQPDNEIEQDGQRVALEMPPETVAVGAVVPDFTLTDSQGRRVSLRELGAGRVVVVQFLYTRCPMPEVCPRLAATFARLQRRFAGRTDLAFLSVTLDPVYDTVEILSRYARLWRAGENWRFVTGTESEIKSVAGRFGIVYWPEEGVITHTSTIGIIGRDGRLRSRVEGLSFSAQQLGDLVGQILKEDENK